MYKAHIINSGKKDIIEIVSDFHYASILEKSGNDNCKIVLPLSLNIGHLKSLEKYDISYLEKYHNFEVYPFEEKLNFEKEFNEIKKIVNNAKKIRIWTSHLDADDYCLLLFICNSFRYKDISVIFVESYNWYATTLGMIGHDEISSLYKYEKDLKKYEIEQYCNEWNKVVEENSEFRFMINGRVKSVSFNYFDNEIINRLKQLGKIKKIKLIADLMVEPIFPMMHISDYIYGYIIDILIKENKIILTREDEIEFLECK